MTQKDIIEARLTSIIARTQEGRDTIMQSAGETVAYQEVIDILDMIAELAAILITERRETARALNSLAQYHN